LQPDKQVKVFVNQTVPLNDKGDIPPYRDDATVILSGNAILTDTLVFDTLTGIYRSPVYPDPNRQYTLDISVPGLGSVSRTVDFPPPPVVDFVGAQVRYMQMNMDYMADVLEIKYKIHDAPGEDFYEIRVRYLCQGSSYDMQVEDPTVSADPVLSNEGIRNGRSIFFSDRLFDGEDYTLRAYYFLPSVFVDGQPQSDTLLIYKYALSRDAFQAYSYLLRLGEGGMPGSMEPDIIPDNIEGGLGIIASKNIAAIDTVVIQL
jgi:hypothetical protein